MIIYKAENKINGKVYIGKTIYSLRIRKNLHNSSAYNKKDNMYFHKAIKKYGKDNFDWSILTNTDSENKLSILEKFYIACYRKMTIVYNLTDGGEGVSGWKHSEKTKYIIKEKRKNQIFTEETRNKLSIIARKKTHSNESKIKIGNARRGKKHTEESKQKNRISHLGLYDGEKNPFFGKKHSTETKLLISKKGKGRKQSQETIAKRVISLKKSWDKRKKQK